MCIYIIVTTDSNISVTSAISVAQLIFINSCSLPLQSYISNARHCHVVTCDSREVAVTVSDH